MPSIGTVDNIPGDYDAVAGLFLQQRLINGLYKRHIQHGTAGPNFALEGVG
jgi:hypothetical protein